MEHDETHDFTPAQALEFACQLGDAGKPQEAEDILRQILVVDPQNPKVMNRLGVFLTKRRSYYEALYRFDRSAKIDPASGLAISNRGMILSELGHNDEAIIDFKRAVELEPKNPICLNNLGNAFERLGRYDEALEAFDRTLLMDPDHAVTHYNRGVVLLRFCRREDAILSFDRAITLNPDDAEAHYNRAGALLTLGRLKEGFAEYEWRLKSTENVNTPYYLDAKAPKWAGQSLIGRSIVVHAEQGIGDTIQFLRYLPMVLARKPTKLYLVVHRGVHFLVKNSFAGEERLIMLSPKEEMPETDYQCPLMSLPHIFETALDSIPEPVVFRPPPDIFDFDGKIRRFAGSKLRVGLCWSGNFQHKNDHHRSIPLLQFSQIMQTDGAAFFSLQKDVRQEDAEAFKALPNLCDLAPKLSNFGDTAVAVGALDLVISVDTSVAHIAATMGVPTWILVPKFSQDWRWLLDRHDSPWYPSARLFRQEKVGDWDSVLAAISLRLGSKTDRLRRVA